VGARSTGEKIVLACESGERESKESWLKVLRRLQERGLKFPRLTVTDGHLSIWAALGEIHPAGEEQRCWNHRLTNVLDALPKKTQAPAAELLKAIPYAETQVECERQRDAFVRLYRKTDPKAVDTLLRDWDRMVTFYAFPKRTLDSPPNDKHRGVALRLRPAPYRRVSSLQAGGGCPGHHLEDAPSGRAGVAQTQMHRSCCHSLPPVCRSKMGG
jgi:hypothetical protein